MCLNYASVLVNDRDEPVLRPDGTIICCEGIRHLGHGVYYLNKGGEYHHALVDERGRFFVHEWHERYRLLTHQLVAIPYLQGEDEYHYAVQNAAQIAALTPPARFYDKVQGVPGAVLVRDAESGLSTLLAAEAEPVRNEVGQECWFLTYFFVPQQKNPNHKDLVAVLDGVSYRFQAQRFVMSPQPGEYCLETPVDNSRNIR